VEVRKVKDIDAWMIAGMFDPDILNLKIKRSLTITVVSGDNDYEKALQNIKKWGEFFGMTLRIRVVSWKYALSKEMKRLANEILYVDDILEEIYPHGYYLLQKDLKKMKPNAAFG